MRTSDRRQLALAISLWLAAWSSAALASPLLELAGGSMGGGLGTRATPSGAAASYFNPALLPDVPAGLSFGFVTLGSSIPIRVGARPEGADVPLDVQNAFRSDGSSFASSPVPTSILEDGRPSDGVLPAIAARPRQSHGHRDAQTYETVGFVLRALQERLTLGFFGLIPNGDYTRLTASYVDEREQAFSNSLRPELYGDRVRSVAVAAAIAVRIDARWSVGIGTTLSLVGRAAAPAYVADASQLENLQLGLDARVKVNASPHLGVSYRPHPRLRLTGTLHTPQKVDLGARFSFNIGTTVSQASGVRFLFDYMPWQLGAGAELDAWQRGARVLTLVAQAVYGRWSQYSDRLGARPTSSFGFDDTLSGVLGTRLRLGRFTALLDLEYRPTPVPPQRGRTNYVDNDRVGAALGAEYTFEVMALPLCFGVQLTGYRLLPRWQRKLSTPTFADGVDRTPQLVRDEVPDDALLNGEPLAGRAGLQTNNPGWPGFGSQGLIGVASAYLKVNL